MEKGGLYMMKEKECFQIQGMKDELEDAIK